MKPWTPFERAKPIVPQWVRDHAPDLIAWVNAQEVWKNSRYTVDVRRSLLHLPTGDATLVHLSIKANDKTAVHDWRDFQRIKNELVGREQEAIELYPAESRLVDTSNQYHLWCVIGSRVPFGFEERLVSQTGDPIGAVQRPFEPDAKPADARYVPMKDCIDQMREQLARDNEKASA